MQMNHAFPFERKRSFWHFVELFTFFSDSAESWIPHQIYPNPSKSRSDFLEFESFSVRTEKSLPGCVWYYWINHFLAGAGWEPDSVHLALRKHGTRSGIMDFLSKSSSSWSDLFPSKWFSVRTGKSLPRCVWYHWINHFLAGAGWGPDSIRLASQSNGKAESWQLLFPFGLLFPFERRKVIQMWNSISKYATPSKCDNPLKCEIP